MISPDFVRTMARYNAWQNTQLMPSLEALTSEELIQDRGAFFGSIFATLNHLLWGDTMWLHRFGAGPAPMSDNHTALTATLTEWEKARGRVDHEIKVWAAGLSQADLDSDLRWASKLSDRSFQHPMGLLVTHFFNHQTHHRGQVHAMLTAAGQPAPVSDLPYMPKE